MGTPSVPDESSGIFADAINIVPSQYSSSNYGNPSSVGQYNSHNSQELGMLVGDGIVLSPNEAQMFKKIQKIVGENKNLKKALVVNSGRLQNHVNDCIQWKENHKHLEDDLKEQLKSEKRATSQLQRRLDFLNSAMSTSSMSLNSNSASPHSSIDFLIAELHKQSKMLADVLQSSNEASQPSEERPLIREAYESTIGAIKEFVTGRKFENLDEALSTVHAFCLPLQSHDGKILRDAITSIQNASKDYQKAVNYIQHGHQIPLIQHVELKNQFEIIIEENQQIKNRLKSYIQQSSELETLINELTKERDEMQTSILEKNSNIQKLTDELENCRSVEILELTPQQQPKEIKQLEANIESYKKTINLLKERNEILHNDLNETTLSFEKIEEENSDLREKNEELEREVERLHESLTPSSDYYVQDGDMSPEQRRFTLQKYSLKVAELEKLNRSLSEELNNSNDKKSLTYESRDNGSIRKQIEVLEQWLLHSNEKLRLKEEELNDVKRELEKGKDGEIEMELTIQQMIEQLKIKDQEIKNTNEMLNNKTNECAASVESCKNMQEELKREKIVFETTRRVQKNIESKDADKINRLMKSIADYKKDYESMRNENEELRQHIESYNSVIHQQISSENLSQKHIFTNLLDKSEELMSIDHKSLANDPPNEESNEEYKKSLLAEITQLSEELEKQHLRMHELQEENEGYKTTIENLTQADRNTTQRLLELQSEYQLLQMNLQEKAQQNRVLHEKNKELEEQLYNGRDELNLMRQQFEDNSESKKEFVEMQNQLEAAQRASEKLKRDNQQTWNNLQLKVKNVRELEENVNELTTELVGAKELIEKLGKKVKELQEKERSANLDSTKMRDQVEEVTVLRMQLDVYKNDFQAERDSREKQQTALLEERERVEQLQLENHRLKEELAKKGDQRLNTIRQRHGSQTFYGNNPQSMDPRQSYGNNQQNNYNPQHYGQDARGQGVENGQSNQWQQQRSIADWEVYGRGNERNEQRRAQRPQNNRIDEDEQRKCPKCQEVLPDLDSLQIHVMECLDK